MGEGLSVRFSLLNLTDERTNTNKFWRVYMVELPEGGIRVAYHWGRNGTKGSSRIDTFPTEAAAQADVERKLQEKRLKGYELLRNGRSAPDAEMLKLLGLTGVKVEVSEDAFAVFETAANAAVRTLTGPQELQDNTAVRQLKELFAELEQRYQAASGWMETVTDLYLAKLES